MVQAMQKNTVGPIEPQGIPQLLRSQRRWLTWRYEANAAGKLTKVPDCSTRDVDAFRTFDEVLAAAQGSRGSVGIGIALTGRIEVADGTSDGVLVRVDLDACVDPATGAVSNWAVGVIRNHGNSYTEHTPSGTGLALWVHVREMPATFTRAKVPVTADPPAGVTKRPELQVFGYGVPQYVTVTGRQLVGTSPAIVSVRNLDWLCTTFGLRTADDADASAPLASGPRPSLDAIEARLRSSPLADAIFDADWHDAAGQDGSASGAFFSVAQAVLQAANGHGDLAVAFVRTRTAWGTGDVEDSADPAKYGRSSWLAAEFRRAAAKTPAGADALALLSPVPPAGGAASSNGVESRRDAWDALVAASPILTVPAASGFFASPPPPRDYLLRHPDGTGFVPRGKVGILNAAGGTGKTTAIVQMAMCLATGRPLFGHYLVPTRPCSCLLLLGEEDAEEVWRKVHYTGLALGLSAAEREAFERKVVCRPLAGHALPLLRYDASGANVEATQHADAIVRALGERDDWGLVAVDPVSRFSGVNVEADNILATRYAQELERFVEAPGKPTVLGAGHTSKDARKSGTADHRGVTGLYDAVRWAVTMLTCAEDMHRVAFDPTKNNLAAPSEGIRLVRGEHGVLTAMSPEQLREVEQAEQDAEAAEAAKADDRVAGVREAGILRAVDLVLEAARRAPGMSANGIFGVVPGKRATVLAAIQRAIVGGLLVTRKDGARVGHYVVDVLA